MEDEKKCLGDSANPYYSQVDSGKNFSPETGEKLNAICNCWVKKKLYNCGYNKCPGHGLIIEEVKKELAR